MATTKPRHPAEKTNQTVFQVHIKHHPELKKFHNLFDFSEFKILSLLKKLSNKRLVVPLKDALESYQNGKIAIGWQQGNPIYIQISDK